MPLFLLVFIRFIRSMLIALRNPEIHALFGWVALLILTGTVFYHHIEGWTYFDAYYFSVITLATVGYGDLTPVTDLGKLFTTVYIFLGVSTLLSFLTVLAESKPEHSLLRRVTGQHRRD